MLPIIIAKKIGLQKVDLMHIPSIRLQMRLIKLFPLLIAKILAGKLMFVNFKSITLIMAPIAIRRMLKA